MAKRAVEPRKDGLEGMVAEYRDKLPIYGEFAISCKGLLEQLVRVEGIRVHSVTCRPKGLDSLRDKLNRAEGRYDALTQVTDLAGIRIITYLSDDVDAIGTMIEREFTVIPEQSIDKRKALDPDRFGYLSLHYVCTLSENRAGLAEYAPYSGYICEIQVRSILQHAWAEIEHDLGYKVAQAVPIPIRRRFFRLAGLLEIADDEFMRIRKDLTMYALEVKRDIAEKPSEVLLDNVSLAAFIDQDETVRRVDRQLGHWAGAELIEPDDYFVETLVEYLRYVGVDTIEHLAAALVERENLVVREWEHVATRGKYETLRRGISLFHLWPVVLAGKGDPREVVVAFDKFGIGRAADREKLALDIVELVRKDSAAKPARRRKRSEEA